MEAQLKRHEPLYLKHRPQALDELVGQGAVTRTLSNAINHDRISHAYLFTGPRGTGKTSSARILAKSLNCKAFEKATVTPCQECASCLEIKQGTSPAVFEIDAASNNSVDDARVLIERAPLVAPGARYKIYIIDECHMLTKEAFNALLKTIEDPPPNVVFVLATTEEHKVLPTIVSRCQRLMFRLVMQDDLVEHLRKVSGKENIAITDRALEFVARRSGGGLRDALGLLDQASLLGTEGQPVDVPDLLALLGALDEDALLEMSEHILHRRGHELLSSANKLLGQGREPAIVVQELARHFLNLTKASYLSALDNKQEAASKLIIASPSYLEGLHNQAPQFDRSELSQMVEQLDRLESTCRRTTQPAMHLEVGLLSLCHRHDMLLVRELADRVAQLEQALAGGNLSAPRAQAVPPAAARPAASAQPGALARPVQPVPAPATTQAQAQAPAPAPAAETLPAPRHETLPSEPANSLPSQAANQLPSQAANALPSQAANPLPSQPANPLPSQAVNPLPAPTQAAAPSPAHPTSGPAQQHATVAGAPPSVPAAASAHGGELPADEVDNIWSQLLDVLQGRSLPTYSLVSSQVFPLSINERELTVGVPNETLQKTVERKAEHIVTACAKVIGKTLALKIRVMAKDMPLPAARPAPAAPREPVPATTATAAPTAADDEEYEPGEYNSATQPPAELNQPGASEPAAVQSAERVATAAGAATATLTRPEATPTSTTPPEPPASESKAAAAVSTEEIARQSTTANNGTIIKEATKLFDGPGSRVIGKPQKD